MKVNVRDYYAWYGDVSEGDEILLSGESYCFRDAAHKRLFDMYARGEKLPVDLTAAAIYYAGPTPVPVLNPENLAVGSCGPTTSARMDRFTGFILALGAKILIGKGERSPEVNACIAENKAIYLSALGGAGALAAKCITSCEVAAFEDLGCESIKKIEFLDFPLYVTAFSKGK